MVFQKCKCFDDTLAYPESGEEQRCSALEDVPLQSAASKCTRVRAGTHVHSRVHT
jgi:hypothetical protein